MFDLSKIFDLSKKFALPDTFLKSKNYCIIFKYIWCNWRENSPLCRNSLDEDLTSEIELVHEKMIQVDVITFVGVDNNFKLQPLSAPFGHLFAGTFLIIMPSLSKLIKVLWWCTLESVQFLNCKLDTQIKVQLWTLIKKGS